MPDEKPEDHLNIREILAKKRNENYTSVWRVPMKKHHKEEKPSDYKDTFSEMKEKLNNKDNGSDSLVNITPDTITISAIKIDYSRENLEKVLDFINDITNGVIKL